MEVQAEHWGSERGELTSSWGVGRGGLRGTCRLSHDDENTAEPLLLPGTKVAPVLSLFYR